MLTRMSKPTLGANDVTATPNVRFWIRRTRAVFVVAAVSALAWSVVGIGLATVVGSAVGVDPPLLLANLPMVAGMFGSVGFAGGALWSIALIGLKRNGDQSGVSAWQGAAAGLFVGAALYLIMLVIFGNPIVKATFELSSLTLYGVAGAVTGYAISRVANHGRTSDS